MPIWFELLMMLLVSYAIGLCTGWLVLDRASTRRSAVAHNLQETGK